MYTCISDTEESVKVNLNYLQEILFLQYFQMNFKECDVAVLENIESKCKRHLNKQQK